MPLIGQGIQVASGPLPAVSASAPPAYDQTQTVANIGLSALLLGNLLQTGTINVRSTSTVPQGEQARATAGVENARLSLVGVLSLLSLNASLIESSAQVNGPCQGQPAWSGSSRLVGATLGGALGLGIQIPVNPAPNTQLISTPVLRVVLNEQFPSVSGNGTAALTVNAVHVYVNALPFTGLGVLTGDVVIAHSRAEMTCIADVPPTPADLALSVSDSPDPAIEGGNVTYGWTVSNTGPGAAQQVVLSAAIPAGATVVSVTPSQGSCTGIATVTCNIGTVAAGGQATVQLVVHTTQSGTLVQTGSVAATTPDPDPSDNQASASTTVEPTDGGGGDDGPIADLSVEISDQPDPAVVGATVTYTVRIVNHGPSNAEAMHLDLALSGAVTILSATASQGGCQNTGVIACDLGDLASGATTQVVVQARARNVGVMFLTASVDCATSDPDRSNNTATESSTATGGTGGGGDGGGGGQNSNSSSLVCPVDAVPAATLLIPFFEVALDDPAGLTTLFSVVNALASPRLVQVTLWTNWGIPSVSFPVYLTGFDLQSFNVRDLLAGNLPRTGPGVSPRGETSGPDLNLASCAQGPASFDQQITLSPPEVAHVRAWHTGAASPLSATCASAPTADGHATGYITVDVVRGCSLLTPADSGYFGLAGVATEDNAIWGDFAFISQRANTAEGDLAVHIVADPQLRPGDYTFYGRYVHGDASDRRRPLGETYGARYLAGGAFTSGTELMVWRDTKSAAATGIPCGRRPDWAPLPQTSLLLFDEQENVVALAPSAQRAPAAAQRIRVGGADIPTPATFGWLMIDLGHDGSNLFDDAAQGWVVSSYAASGRYSLNQRAVRLDSVCVP